MEIMGSGPFLGKIAVQLLLKSVRMMSCYKTKGKFGMGDPERHCGWVSLHSSLFPWLRSLVKKCDTTEQIGTISKNPNPHLGPRFCHLAYSTTICAMSLFHISQKKKITSLRLFSQNSSLISTSKIKKLFSVLILSDMSTLFDTWTFLFCF